MTQPSRIDGLPDMPKRPLQGLSSWLHQMAYKFPPDAPTLIAWAKEATALVEAGSAAAAQAAKQVPAGWQPIETAPRDGTHILACHAGRPYDDLYTFNQAPPSVVHWFGWPEDAAGFYLSVSLGEQKLPFNYTHWKPLGAEPCDTKRLGAEAAHYPQTEAQLVCDHCGADRLKQPCGEPHRPDGCRFTGKAQAAAPSATSMAEAAEAGTRAGFVLVVDESIPDGEAHVMQNNKRIATITNIAATPASPQAPAPQAVVGEASERLKRMGRLAEKIHEMASGIKDYVTSRDIGESALALMIDIQAECRATPTPAPSAALHQGADALREATFDDWWYGHDGVRQRQVAYLGWPCTKELAETIWNGARAALSQHQAPKDDPENDLTAYERWHGI